MLRYSFKITVRERLDLDWTLLLQLLLLFLMMVNVLLYTLCKITVLDVCLLNVEISITGG